MSTTFLTIYLLMWPAIASSVFIILVACLYKDIKQAKKQGNSLV
jgi:hypothetical protein